MGVCESICNDENELEKQLKPDSKSNRIRVTDTTEEAGEGKENALDAFQNAIASGNESLAQFFIDENSNQDLVNLKNMKNKHYTALMVAAQSKAITMIRFLLERGAKINEQDEFGETALHIATDNGDLEAVKLLCEYGVDKTIATEKGETALDIALYNDEDVFRAIASVIEPDQEKLILMQKPYKEGSHPRVTSSNLAGFADDILELSAAQSLEEHVSMDAEDLFADFADDVRKTARELPILHNWLEKKQQSPPYSWQRRWVVAFKGYMLWADRQIEVDFEKEITAQEIHRWNTAIDLTQVTTIQSFTNQSKSKDRKFVLTVNKRKYTFRCESQSLRDHWLQWLEQHREHAEKSSLYHLESKIKRKGARESQPWKKHT